MPVYLKILFFFLLTSLNRGFSQQIFGTITDEISAAPIDGAQVSVVKSGQLVKSFNTKVNGQFFFDSLSPGYYHLIVVAKGFQTMTRSEILIAGGKQQIVNVEMVSPNQLLSGALIKSEGILNRENQLLGEIGLKREQIFRYPAVNFDPARLAASFSGIAQTDDGTNGLSIRGNSPGTLRWRLAGIDIVNPNHLPNAGTFDDRAASSSGGVLLFSAQLLSNCSAITGAYSPGLGDVNGGIMDMHLREGNTRRPEHTVQAGLTGLDVATEGPVPGGGSYLVNYRYSTVGILGLLGISFGGERIGFQDLSFQTSLKGKKGGTWKAFAVSGVSHNRFYPKTDSIRNYKETRNIDFKSQTEISGWTFQKSVGFRTNVQMSMVFSGQKNAREEASRVVESSIRDGNTEFRVGYQTNVTHHLTERIRLKGGLYFQGIGYRSYSQVDSSPQLDQSTQIRMLQPWISSTIWSRNRKWMLMTGIHSINLAQKSATINDARLEPRIALQYKIGNKHRLLGSHVWHSQLAPLWVLADKNNDRLELVRSRSATLAYLFQIGTNTNFKLEGFLQSQKQVPVSSIAGVFSVINEQALRSLPALRQDGKGLNRGVEISLDRKMEGSWFFNANLSFLDSRFMVDGIWRSSRWDIGRQNNLVVGKEWYRNRKKGITNTFGINMRLMQRGGFRSMPIDEQESELFGETRFNADNGYTAKENPYARADVRICWRKSRDSRRNALFAIDIQNVTNRDNIGYLFYDPFLKLIAKKSQLGLIPNLSWRVEF